MIQTALQTEDTRCERLFVALELSNRKWKLAMTARGRKREVTVAAGDMAALLQAFDKAKAHFKLDAASPVMTCYEAGRDGFWLHRELERSDVTNLVVDATSIEVDRRHRRAKTDRLDAWRLLSQLARYADGDRRALRVVRVPSVQAEDARRPHRELQRLRQERAAHANRIRSLLVLHGVRLPVSPTFTERLRHAGGSEGLPAHLRAEVLREFARWQLVSEQIQALEGQLQAQLKEQAATDPGIPTIQKLYRLRALGAVGATVFTRELFGWREFRNRRELGAASGLVNLPYASGDRQSDQGISKAGNRRVRATLIQIAWGWLRYQPNSALSHWFQQRFAGSARLRRIGIVALARRLLIALWRYVRDGVIPEGAQLKPIPAMA